MAVVHGLGGGGGGERIRCGNGELQKAVKRTRDPNTLATFKFLGVANIIELLLKSFFRISLAYVQSLEGSQKAG